jgi:hypothetical protein
MFDRTRFPFTLQNKSRRLVVFQDHFVSWAVTLYLGLGASHITTAQDAWTYSTPQLPEIPAVIHTSSIQNDIDAFILRKLEAHSLTTLATASTGRVTGLTWPAMPTLRAMRGILTYPMPGDIAITSSTRSIVTSPIRNSFESRSLGTSCKRFSERVNSRNHLLKI